jgi:hypothetical protein
MTKVPTKTASISLRVAPDVKDMLANAAQADRRSIANMLEVMVIDYCRRHEPATAPLQKLHQEVQS